MAFQLRAKAFEANGTIPKKFSCDEADVSPALEWDDSPSGTKCFALIVDDPDAPGGAFVHWLVYGIPPDTTELPEHQQPVKRIANGARQGVNGFGGLGYGGPQPPSGTHRSSISQ